MPRNEEGEFELVLGNRQLLSVFFILVVLLGVFFTMGYIVGRSNAPEQVQTAAARPPDQGRGALVVDPAQPDSAQAAGRPSPATQPPAQAAKPVATTPPPAKPDTRPVEPAKTTPAKPVPEPPKPEPVKPAPVKPAPAPPAPAAAGGLPQTGATYLQVAAIDRAGADILADSLRKKSFPSMVAPGPSPTLFRVLVGPVRSKEDLAKVKADLEAVGLKGPIVRQY